MGFFCLNELFPAQRYLPLGKVNHGQDLLYLVGDLCRLANRLLTHLTAIKTCDGGHEVCLQVRLIAGFPPRIQMVNERVG
jgi:hypothetical protein